MLVKTVLAQLPFNVRLIYEDFGESALTDRYGIKGYPAVFVNELPVALPHDFGYGRSDDAKYTPWADPETQQRFAADLRAILTLAAADEPIDEFVREVRNIDPYPARLPAIAMTDSRDRAIDTADLAGRIVIVDFWATWCPPCRRTLPEMEALAKRWGEKVAVLTVCVASPAEEMERVRATLAPGLPAIAATDDVIAAFGNITNVPTLMVFAPDGRRAQVFIGAPEDLPRTLDALVEELSR